MSALCWDSFGFSMGINSCRERLFSSLKAATAFLGIHEHSFDIPARRQTGLEGGKGSGNANVCGFSIKSGLQLEVSYSAEY